MITEGTVINFGMKNEVDIALSDNGGFVISTTKVKTGAATVQSIFTATNIEDAIRIVREQLALLLEG
jgi:hypothetical protein